MTTQDQGMSAALAALAPEVAEAFRALQRRDFAGCEARCRETLSRDPSHGDALHLLGLALSASGKPAEGLDALRRAVQASPQHGAYRFSLGRQLAANGDHQAAIDEFKRTLELAPRMAQAGLELGRCYERLGDRRGALEAYNRAADAQGDFAPAHFALAGVLRQIGRKDEALERYRRAVAVKPDFGEAHYNLGLLLRELDRLEEAEGALARATELMPRMASAWTSRGAVLSSLHRNAEAESCLLRALELNPDDLATRNNLGNILLLQSRPDEAIVHFHAALALDPDSPAAQLGAGLALRGQLKVKEALAALDRALALDPQSVSAMYAIAEAHDRTHAWEDAERWARRALERNAGHRPSRLLLGRLMREAGRYDEAAEMIAPLLEGDASEFKRVPALRELGHIQRGRGAYDEAFARYEEAGAVLSAQPGVKALLEKPMSAALASMPEHLGRGVIATWDDEAPGDGLMPPVMLCGFPNSGLTLVEQMLRCVPGVATTDDAPTWAPVLSYVGQTAGAYRPYPQCLDDLLDDQILECRRAYHDAASRLAGVAPECRVLVDRYLFSMAHLGLVRRIFPGAKVLMVHRDPRDVVLECFSQVWSINQATASFASLVGTAELYDAFVGLWGYFKDALSLETREIRYEDVVTDPRRTMRGVLEWLGLEWNDRVLHAHEHVRGTALRSHAYRDVAGPLDPGRIGGWRAFERHLAPAMPIIAGRVKELGYA